MKTIENILPIFLATCVLGILLRLSYFLATKLQVFKIIKNRNFMLASIIIMYLIALFLCSMNGILGGILFIFAFVYSMSILFIYSEDKQANKNHEE